MGQEFHAVRGQISTETGANRVQALRDIITHRSSERTRRSIGQFQTVERTTIKMHHTTHQNLKNTHDSQGRNEECFVEIEVAENELFLEVMKQPSSCLTESYMIPNANTNAVTMDEETNGCVRNQYESSYFYDYFDRKNGRIPRFSPSATGSV